MKCKLVPIQSGVSTFGNKSPYFEQVIIYFGTYPNCMVHIDFFFTGRKDLYEALSRGQTVEANIEITPLTSL